MSKRGKVFVLVALAIVLCSGAGIGAFAVLSNQRLPAAPASASGGQAFFVSSGQLKEGNSQGINDEVRIILRNVPDPAPGVSYYAWLLSDKGVSPQQSLLLGRLSVAQGSVSFLYQGDAQHTDLLGVMSRLLITEEDAAKTPDAPTANLRQWRYYAELPQERSPIGLHRRVIDTLRDLLYDASHLQPLAIHGGSDIRLLRNTEKILEWASSARDAWQGNDFDFIHRQLVRILDYLDGASLVGQDVPSGTPLLVDPTLAHVPLIDIQPKQQLLSYIDRMNNQLSGLAHQPGTTPTMLRLAKQADTTLLQDVKIWLGKTRLDAKQLASMSSTQMRQASALALLDDLQLYANEALVGRLDPATDALQGGVVQIHDDVQLLVTFNVQPYQGH